ERLANEMRAGRLIPGMQIYVCFTPDGQGHIVNGNHTLEAIALCGVPQTLTVTRHKVASIEEAGKIYAAFDMQSNRSWGDITRATGQQGMVDNQRQVLAAIGCIKNDMSQGWGGRVLSKMEILDALGEY